MIASCEWFLVLDSVVTTSAVCVVTCFWAFVYMCELIFVIEWPGSGRPGLGRGPRAQVSRLARSSQPCHDLALAGPRCYAGSAAAVKCYGRWAARRKSNNPACEHVC